MSAPIDVTAQNAVLDAQLGDNHASTMPTAFQLAIFDGDPNNGGAELTSAGGYARVTGIPNDSTNFPDAVSGMKTMAKQTYADSTGAYSGIGSWWVLLDDANPTVLWYALPLDGEVDVEEAGSTVMLQPRIYWNTAT